MSSSKKKICFFTTVDWFILTHRKKLLRELIKSYDVTVIVFENTKKLEISFPKLEILSLNISRSNVSFFKNILSFFKLFKISNKKKFDLFYVVLEVQVTNHIFIPSYNILRNPYEIYR